ncbi:hypothetical protein RYZ20_11595 [Thioclava sp. A2]|nr:hypothetical protein [Thioclava sp. A2]
MMSDPRTNIEVEDVLSSIRRLISQDAAVRQSPVPHRSASGEALEDDAPMLVLTPAQRISAECEAEDVSTDVDAAPCGDLGEELTRLEATIAEMEAVVAESPVDFEPEQGDAFAPEGTEPLQELPETFDETRFEPVEGAAQETAIVFEHSPPEAEEEQLMTEEEPDRAALADDGLPPLEEAEIVDETALDDADPDLQDEAWAQSASDDWAEDLREEAEAAVESLAMGAVADELRHLTLEDAQETGNEHEPRMSSYDEMREDLALEEALDMDIASDGMDGSALPFDAEDLRDMVAIMIREELQGTLGERITRNVRKLVRREIQRALLSRDME